MTDQTTTYTYGAVQVISQYLKPLCKNEFNIEDTQLFSKKVRDIPALENEEEDVLYDDKSLFTNISLKETVNYKLDQICVQKMLPLSLINFVNKLVDAPWVDPYLWHWVKYIW